jgi:hypothetical protein
MVTTAEQEASQAEHTQPPSLNDWMPAQHATL